MTTKKLTKLLALYLPYILLGLVATNFGEAWRLAEGKELGERIMSMMGTIPVAFANPLPSLHPLDLLVGLCCGAGMRLAVYLRGKNAKKYRHGMEYGSARWGNAKDIEPFMAPKFSDNIILTKTERLMMSNRPPDPKNARNKNVLVVGGSGSGKTRFWLKPNLLQCHSSYVVTDPKGTIVLECGQAMLKNGYKVKVLNTINFKKSIYNMKKVCLAVLPALTIVLELLPLGAVCIFATSPTERVKETFSYFSLTPFGSANFAPLITATLTVAIFLLSLFSLKKKGVLKALFVLSIITVVISLLPLMYGLDYYTLVGAFITGTLVIESVLAKIQQK